MEAIDRHHRPENLRLSDGCIITDVGEERRFVEQSTRIVLLAAHDDTSTVGACVIDRARDLVEAVWLTSGPITKPSC